MTTTLQAKVLQVKEQELKLSTVLSDKPTEITATHWKKDHNLTEGQLCEFNGYFTQIKGKLHLNISSAGEDYTKYPVTALVGIVSRCKVMRNGTTNAPFVNFNLNVNHRGNYVTYKCTYNISEKQLSIFNNLEKQLVGDYDSRPVIYASVVGNVKSELEEYKTNKGETKYNVVLSVREFNLVNSNNKKDKDTDLFAPKVDQFTDDDI